MKTKLNDYSKKYKKNNKETISHKKTNNINKITNFNIYISSSLPKVNKTLKKYINEKLNVKKNKYNNLYQEQNPHKSNSKNSTLLIYNRENMSLNQYKIQKSKDKNTKQNSINEQIYSKKKFINLKYNYIHKSNYSTENNKTINFLLKRKQSKKQLKIINSVSTSTRMSSSSNKVEENGKFLCHNYYNNNKKDKSNITYDRNNNKNSFLDESNYCKHKINNFNYETGSDDNLNENIIFLKNDNSSSLTFRNSFTYSNSQRSKSTKKSEINDKVNNNLTFYYKNNYVNKLKEENETLKKELKESNDQITLLKYKIKELKEVNSKIHSRNKKFAANIWSKKLIKYELIENKSIKEFSLDNEAKEKIKCKKEFIETLNHTINENNFSKDNKKYINVKRNLNLKKKIKRDSNNDFSSICLLDKPCENISECISNLKL